MGHYVDNNNNNINNNNYCRINSYNRSSNRNSSSNGNNNYNIGINLLLLNLYIIKIYALNNDASISTNNSTIVSSNSINNSIPSWACFIRYCCHFYYIIINIFYINYLFIWTIIATI